MSAMSWHRPHTPLAYSAIGTQIAGLVATYAVALAVSRPIGASPAFALIASAVFATVAVVALGHLDGHPFRHFGAANRVTTVRVLVVSLVAALIGEGQTTAVAWTAALGGCASTVLDGVDGWLARRSGMASAFGARYDMEIDALLIVALATLAWRHEKAGAWILLAGAMRYLFVAAGYAWSWMNAPLPPSFRRKAVCVVQIVGLILAVAPMVPAPLSIVIGLVTLMALLWSFGIDTLWLWTHGE